jgi:VWFA-related protein
LFAADHPHAKRKNNSERPRSLINWTAGILPAKTADWKSALQLLWKFLRGGINFCLKMKFLGLILFLSLLALSVTAEYNEQVAVDATHVYFSALDKKHEFVSDLRVDDLVVTENGTAQKILGISNLAKELGPTAESREPLTVVFSMDTSASMSEYTAGQAGKMSIIKEAATDLLQFLRADDQMTVVGFNAIPRAIVPLTSDKEQIAARLSHLYPIDADTALLDSVYVIVDKMKDFGGRKFLVLGSDGIDTASHIKLDEVLEQLNTSDVTVLVFGLPSAGMSSDMDSAHYTLKRIAEITGGYAFFLNDTSTLPDVMKQIGRALRSQYVLWYTPQQKVNAKSWRNLQIMCKRPGIDLHYRTKILTHGD